MSSQLLSLVVFLRRNIHKLTTLVHQLVRLYGSLKGNKRNLYNLNL